MVVLFLFTTQQRLPMKKQAILNLIRYHAENNDAGFRAEAYEIAKEFDRLGDSQLASFVMAQLSDTNTFVPQSASVESPFLKRFPPTSKPLFLPDTISNDILGIAHAVQHRIGVHRFLFQGEPGTGKTEAVKQLARILGREPSLVEFSNVIDSRLGQTQKNIAALFSEINRFPMPETALVLFDEIDAIALDRTNPNDLREMGRATTAILKGLDELNDPIVLVATTNLFNNLDKALVRRFDFVVDFNRYSDGDLLEIAEKMMDQYLEKIKPANRDIRLFRKIMELLKPLPMPGDLQNIVRTAVAFSDPADGTDYFRRLFAAVTKGSPASEQALRKSGFTVREIGILTKQSKSTVGRNLQTGD